MMYRVILDGNDLLDYQDKRYVLRNPSLEMEVNTVLSKSFGFGGTNSALVIKKII